jgi:hypothetical protein
LKPSLHFRDHAPFLLEPLREELHFFLRSGVGLLFRAQRGGVGLKRLTAFLGGGTGFLVAAELGLELGPRSLGLDLGLGDVAHLRLELGADARDLEILGPQLLAQLVLQGGIARGRPQMTQEPADDTAEDEAGEQKKERIHSANEVRSSSDPPRSDRRARVVACQR